MRKYAVPESWKMRKFEPLMPDHPLVTGAMRCNVCAVVFVAGDEVALLDGGPMDEKQAAKAQAGRPFTARGLPIHWRCRPASESA